MYQILTIALIFLAIGGASYAFVSPYLSGENQVEKKLKAMAETASTPNKIALAEQERRGNVAAALKEMDTRQKNRNKLTVEKRIAYAGVGWSKKTFFLISIACAIVFALIMLIITSNKIVALGGLFIGGFGIPIWILKYLSNRRSKQFLAELPAAMDIIVRGVRVGLPIRDCLRTIVNEMSGPIQVEFRGVTDAMAVGIPLREAIFRIASNVPLPEAQFIAIVISLQQVSGGNLSTAFSSLAQIMRDRKKMRDKVTALSMEAKASAGIIGSLPIVVATLVHFSTPAYLDPLFYTDTGNMILIGGDRKSVV